MSNIANWSSIDENNNKVPPDGWPEHQSPSSVNNSARAMMGALRRSYLELPYFNPGGQIEYLNESTFQIKDTNEIKDFSQFYTIGRRLKFISPNGVLYGNVASVRYGGAVAEIKCMLDSGRFIDSQTTEVYCGLEPADAGEIVGRLPVGMILPYTAMSLPAGFLYADGKSFDPSIYTELARIWKTGEDTYLYGQEVVGGRVWVKTPDVRGQFPRYLDAGAGIDPDGDTREIGSVQGDAIRNITGKFTSGRGLFGVDASGAIKYTGNTSGEAGGGAFGSYKANYELDVSEVVPTAEENRPKNIAFPALIVAWHGVTPAENITIQDLLAAFNTMQGSIDQIYEAKDEALSDFQTEVSEIYSQTSANIEKLTSNAETQISNTTSAAVGTVNATSEAAVLSINATSQNAVGTVNTTTQTAIASVEGKAEEITSAGDVQVARMKQAAQEEIAIAQSWATGDISSRPEGSAKHWAESINSDNFAQTDLSNTSQLTNCILATGCNIQLEWTSTTLTLKAGSKAYTPDGVLRNLNADYTDTSLGTIADGIYVLIMDYNSQGFTKRLTTRCYSSAESPSETTYDTHYNYATRQISVRQGSSWVVASAYTIPFAQITIVSGQITEVVKLDTVSYIGDTAFRMPLTALIANGRNDDGTLKTLKVSFADIAQDTAYSQGDFLMAANGGIFDTVSRVFIESLNRMQNTSTGVFETLIRVADNIKATASQITYMKPTGVVRLLTNRDYEKLSISSLPDYSAGVSYIVGNPAPSSGFFYIYFSATAAAGYMKFSVNGVQVVNSKCDFNSTIFSALIPCSKGDVLTNDYIEYGTKVVTFFPMKG